MRCPYHPQARTLLRPVPLDVYTMDGTPPYRIQTQLETCEQCGAAWYDDTTFPGLTRETLGGTPPAPTEDYGC
jgi:hypothetical protein